MTSFFALKDSHQAVIPEIWGLMVDYDGRTMQLVGLKFHWDKSWAESWKYGQLSDMTPKNE